MLLRVVSSGLIRSGVAIALMLVLAACSREPPPNVLLVTFDTTRYDHFGCSGDPEAKTPTVDALAARGLFFEHAYASVALTLPSHTTILSGLEPLSHGVHNNGRFVVPADLDTLAEHLGASGYDTAAFVSAFVLDARYNLSQGFETYSDETQRTGGPLNFMVPQRPGEEVTDEALVWLQERSGERPYFLWVHYYDPHRPLEVPPPFDSMPDLYAAEIAYADAQLARLLEHFEQTDSERPTLIVFTADHGEGLGEHGETTHGLLAYDSTLHVPLILVGPGIPRGARSDAFVRHVDILPTVLERVGLRVPGELPGRHLLRATQDGDPDDEAVAGYFESRGPHYDQGWAALEGVRTGRWKYTALPAPPELYDIRSDPREQSDRSADEPEVVARMEALRSRLRAEYARPDLATGPHTPAPDEMEQLAALGYVEAKGTFAAGEEPDPRRFVGVFSWIDQARSIASRGAYARAIEILETLRQSASVRPLVLRSLAPIYAEGGRYDDAIAAYEDYIELTGAQEAHLGLARTLLRAGRPAEALDKLEAVSAPSPGTEILLAYALGRVGRNDEARAAVDRAFAARPSAVQRLQRRAALVIDVAPIADGESELRALLAAAPEDPLLLSQLGYYLALWGRPEQSEEALELLQTAAEEAPDNAEILGSLGWGAHKLGRHTEAVEALEAALALDEARHLERARLGLALRAAGEPARAREELRRAYALRPGAQWAEEVRDALSELARELPAPVLPTAGEEQR